MSLELLGAVWETIPAPTLVLKLGAQNSKRDRNWKDLQRDMTDPKEVTHQRTFWLLYNSAEGWQHSHHLNISLSFLGEWWCTYWLHHKDNRGRKRGLLFSFCCLFRALFLVPNTQKGIENLQLWGKLLLNMIKGFLSLFYTKACKYQAIRLENHILSIFKLYSRLHYMLIMIKYFAITQRRLNNQSTLPIQLLNIYPTGSQMWSPYSEH